MARTGIDRWWARKVGEVVFRRLHRWSAMPRTEDSLDREGIVWWFLGEPEMADLMWRRDRSDRWPYPDHPMPRLRLFWWGRR